MSDLEHILEEEYKKSKEVSITDIKQLLHLIEEMYDGFPLVNPPITEEKKVTKQGEGEVADVTIALPFLQLSEAWGKPDAEQRGEVTKFVDQLGPPEGTAIETLRSRLLALQQFNEDYLGDVVSNTENLPISQVIANILLLDTLSAIVTGGEEAQYSASPAGFLFEGFLAALAGGTSAQIPAAGAKTIADITIDLGEGTDGIPVSLKLLARKGGVVKGSVRDLLKSFGDAGAEIQQQYDMAAAETLIEKEAMPQAGAVVADTSMVGMKYIIVIKSVKPAGTRLQFYEWDFTLEKFLEFQKEGKKVPPIGSKETQFHINLTTYVEDSVPIGPPEGVVLESPKSLKLKAEAVLKDLYKEFYDILHTLKRTTDSLNTYLSDPQEEKQAGHTAATEAGHLETEISLTAADK